MDPMDLVIGNVPCTHKDLDLLGECWETGTREQIYNCLKTDSNDPRKIKIGDILSQP